MTQAQAQIWGPSEDDLNELMPKHFRKSAQLEDADGDTLRLTEYLSSKSSIQSLQGLTWGSNARPFGQTDPSRSGIQHPKKQSDITALGGHIQSKGNMERGTGGQTEQENIPPSADALSLFLSKPRPTKRGIRTQGTGRVPEKKRRFGLDLRQFAQQKEGDDSETEWEAREQELAKQKAQSAQGNNQRRRQSASGKRQSRGSVVEDMELDSGADGSGEGMAGDLEGGQEEEKMGLGQGGSVKANADWKTNPIFDEPWLTNQPPPEPQTLPNPALATLPKANVLAPPSPVQTPPPQKSTTPEVSFSAQAQKLAEQILKERAVVHDTEAMAAAAADEANAGRVADDVDFPALEGSPPRVDSVDSKEDELVPTEMTFEADAHAERQEAEPDRPEVLDGPAKETTRHPTTSKAPAAATAPLESRAIVRFVEQKPVPKLRRLKSMLDKSRKSLANAGLTIEHGVRRSTRARQRPLQWWRNESYDWERSHDSLPTISRVNLLSPDPTWPRNDSRKKVMSRTNNAASKLPALTLTSA